MFEDLAGAAGGAFSVLVGVRDEAEAALKARVDELARHFDVASRSDLEAVQELAANARTAGEELATRLEAALLRLDAIESRLREIEDAKPEGSEQAAPKAE